MCTIINETGMRIQLFQPQAIHELGGRKNQEDSIYPLMGMATAENRIFVVCDGMGGADKGEVASAAVRDAIGKACESLYDPQHPFTDDDFNDALQRAYDALDQADVRHEGTMGTTMTFICFHIGGCLVAHIGDSRIYHLRPSLGYPEGVLYRSRDHSLVQQLYDLGEISYNDMATSPRKNIILKAMQPYQDGRTNPSFAHITDVKKGDYFYLCTDGMLEQMEDDELLGIVADPGKTEEEKVERLIELTKDNADNHSAYLIRVDSVLADPDRDKLYVSDESELRAKNKALHDTRKDEVWSDDLPEPITLDKAKTAPDASTRRSAPTPKSPTAKKVLLPFGLMGVLVLLMLVVGIGVGVLLFWGTKEVSEIQIDTEGVTERVENSINSIDKAITEIKETVDGVIQRQGEETVEDVDSESAKSETTESAKNESAESETTEASGQQEQADKSAADAADDQKAPGKADQKNSENRDKQP